MSIPNFREIQNILRKRVENKTVRDSRGNTDKLQSIKGITGDF